MTKPTDKPKNNHAASVVAPQERTNDGLAQRVYHPMQQFVLRPVVGREPFPARSDIDLALETAACIGIQDALVETGHHDIRSWQDTRPMFLESARYLSPALSDSEIDGLAVDARAQTLQEALVHPQSRIMSKARVALVQLQLNARAPHIWQNDEAQLL